MKYVEGVDYWVRLVEFPNMASPSVAVIRTVAVPACGIVNTLPSTEAPTSLPDSSS